MRCKSLANPDDLGESRRAPDVVVARANKDPKNDALRGTPVLAVEVRATQAKKHLEEKVKLYIEHDWPIVWLVHTERREVEVRHQGVAPVIYRLGASVPLPPELDKHGLSAFPVRAFFDAAEASKYIDRWAQAKGFADGRVSGFADGRVSGFADGREEGLKAGVAQGIGQSLLSALMVRGFDAPAAVRDRIRSCTDPDTLQRWLTLVLVATSVDDFIAKME